MIDRKISVHLQDFPNLSFLNDEKDLVKAMDMVRLICSSALSIRDNKNLRVRLPLNQLKVIGANASFIKDFQEIIAEEVNVKNVVFEEKIDGLAELKLQVNFKKIGAKYGPKVKDITSAVKNNQWSKISTNEIEIAGVKLIDDEFEIKLLASNQNDKKFASAALPTNDCLVLLDIEVTKELEEEGIARDIVRAIQQSRKDADLNISNRINIKLFSSNKTILEVAKKFSSYIKEQVLALEITDSENASDIEKTSKFFFNSKIDDGDLAIGIDVV